MGEHREGEHREGEGTWVSIGRVRRGGTMSMSSTNPCTNTHFIVFQCENNLAFGRISLHT
jgi:hypothetical protein